MTAPAPSPDEQAVIDRFGIFDEELLAADEATRLWDGDVYAPPVADRTDPPS